MILVNKMQYIQSFMLYKRLKYEVFKILINTGNIHLCICRKYSSWHCKMYLQSFVFVVLLTHQFLSGTDVEWSQKLPEFDNDVREHLVQKAVSEDMNERNLSCNATHYNFSTTQNQQENIPIMPLKRVIKCVDRDMFNKKVVYDPNKSFVDQIQENREKRGMRFLDNRFTELQINNLIISIDCDTKIPYQNSEYILTAHIKDDTKPEQQITFKLLNGDEYYTSSFDNVGDVDKFLNLVHNKGDISYEGAIATRNSFDAKIRMQERHYTYNKFPIKNEIEIDDLKYIFQLKIKF